MPDPDQEPRDVRRRWDSVLPLLDQVQEDTPTDIANDLNRFTKAMHSYATHLETIDYNLEAMFATQRGKKIAVETSHALSPALVESLEEDCEISFK